MGNVVTIGGHGKVALLAAPLLRTPATVRRIIACNDGATPIEEGLGAR